MITLDFICELEQRLHHTDIRRNRQKAENLLSPDFVEFGSSGEVYDKASTLNALEAEKCTAPRLRGFGYKLHYISTDAVLLTYISEAFSADDVITSRNLRSSLWINHNGHWKMHFHQGTQTTI
ncbi:DUF4440 domain-containing protein [Pseudochrobactrum sp. MP213Fo]|uniref:nuclear transport factor 2 family protein n=1 Tax=Pseudochrobactrum sp. MP213Fo TaxID=3022250 RepID=UPI003BA09253